MAGAKIVSFLLGAEVPIALTSRTTTVENKFNTLAVAAAMIDDRKKV
jgi:phosphotransacetylase